MKKEVFFLFIVFLIIFSFNAIYSNALPVCEGTLDPPECVDPVSYPSAPTPSPPGGTCSVDTTSCTLSSAQSCPVIDNCDQGYKPDPDQETATECVKCSPSKFQGFQDCDQDSGCDTEEFLDKECVYRFYCGDAGCTCVFTQCNDGIDNDNDGFCDYDGCSGMSEDPSCTDINDDNEWPIDIQCGNTGQPCCSGGTCNSNSYFCRKSDYTCRWKKSNGENCVLSNDNKYDTSCSSGYCGYKCTGSQCYSNSKCLPDNKKYWDTLTNSIRYYARSGRVCGDANSQTTTGPGTRC